MTQNHEQLKTIISRLMEKPKGLLAIDESNDSCNKRFTVLGIEPTEENRRKYREILVTTPDIEQYVSGYIMYDETIKQSTLDGWRFPDVLHDKGIEIGIKVDQGLELFPGSDVEQVTKGLSGLTERLVEYRDTYGASFTKWRSVIHISDIAPTDEVLVHNAKDLAQYAKTVQDAGMVPIIEPEVLINGSHTLEKCYEVTKHNLEIVFKAMQQIDVYLPGLILKTSMVITGDTADVQATPDEVATMTVKCLQEVVPENIGGIVFLSGGQEQLHAAIHLSMMSDIPNLSWPLTFSYSRAIQNDTLHAFAHDPSDIATAQEKLLYWARMNTRAVRGELS
jgi:fructose-bisphosphate aldolase class I